ncbi:hypothetical protein BVIET440_160058 [Burkholderia vietnamiensis]
MGAAMAALPAAPARGCATAGHSAVPGRRCRGRPRGHVAFAILGNAAELIRFRSSDMVTGAIHGSGTLY